MPIEMSSSPLPLVAPYLATTTEPPAVRPKFIDINISMKPKVIPAARPLLPPWLGGIPGEVVYPNGRSVDPQSASKPLQETEKPHWLSSPSGAKMLLGLISSGLSQFIGGVPSRTEGGDNFLSQLPQFLRLLQAG